MAALQVAKANLYVFGISRFTKNHRRQIINTKLDQGEDRLTQTLVFPKFSYIYTEIHGA